MFCYAEMQDALATLDPELDSLTALELESIELFIGFFKLIGLQKSVGEIYGLLFLLSRVLAINGLIDRMGICLGAASQGLKVLRSVEAVKMVSVPGDRRDHYVADLQSSNFPMAFIQDELKSRLDGLWQGSARWSPSRASWPLLVKPWPPSASNTGWSEATACCRGC